MVNVVGVGNSNTMRVTLPTLAEAPDAADATDDDVENFFDNIQDNEGDLHDEMGHGLRDLNDYSADQFSLDKRHSFYMERQLILSNNRTAVEFIYMLEAESWVHSSGTLNTPDLKNAVHSKYFELFVAFPLTSLVNLDCVR